MSSVFVSIDSRIRMLLRGFIRNGAQPVAELQGKLAEATGHAIQARTKQVFQRYSPIASIPSSAGSSRVRWRFAFHTGPFAGLLGVRMEIAPEDDGTPGDPFCRLDIALASAPTVVVGSAKVVYGSSDGSFADVPWNMGGGLRFLDSVGDGTGDFDWLLPDTEYVGTFYDLDHARLFGATVFEVSLEPDTDNGYPATGTGAGGPIFDEDRAAVQDAARLLWARTAVPLWHGGSESNVGARVSSADNPSGILSQSIGDFGLVADGTVAIAGVLSKSIGTFSLSSQGTVPTPDLTGGQNWSVSPVSPGGTSVVTVNVAATGSDQTSISLVVRIGEIGSGLSGLLGSAPTTTSLGGWTQSVAWSNSSGTYWEATFTRASLTVAESFVFLGITVVASPSSVEEYGVRSSASSAQGGAYSTGGPALAIAPAFEATIVTPADSSVHNVSAGTAPVACTCRIVAQGAAQTSGTVEIRVRDNYDAMIEGVSTTDLDGWTQSSAWAALGGIWRATFTKASITPGTDEIDFEIDYLNANDNHTTISTNDDGAPQTAQATGVGNDITIEVNM